MYRLYEYKSNVQLASTGILKPFMVRQSLHIKKKTPLHTKLIKKNSALTSNIIDNYISSL